MSEERTADLVAHAAAGDAAAWRALVDRYTDVVWSVARAHRLPECDAADVSQATWLSFAQHLCRLRDPDRVAAWLATTARRESLRVLAVRRREPPLDPSDFESIVDESDVDDSDVLWRALRGLPERCRALLRLIAFTPDLSYAQAARALGIPAGSVGQTRGRCLAALRRRLECEWVGR